MLAWIPVYAVLMAVSWFGTNQKAVSPVPVAAYTKAVLQALLDASSPPAPSRVMGGHFVNRAGAFAPTSTFSGPAPRASPSPSLLRPLDTTMVAFAAAIVLLFLLSSLWFLHRATIVGGAFAPTRADTEPSSSPTESRWEILSSVLCAWLIAKVAALEGVLAAKAAAFSEQLAEQARVSTAAAVAAAADAANAQLGLMAHIEYLTADINRAKEDQQVAEANAAAAMGQLADSNKASVAAAQEAADENLYLLLRVYKLSDMLNSAYGDKNAATAKAAAATAEADKYTSLQRLHEALQASYATISREQGHLRQEVEYLRRGVGAAPGLMPHQQRQQQQFGPGFRPQQQQPPRGGNPYAPNPGPAFGQFRR